MKKKVLVATLREAAGSYPLAGDTTINGEKHPGVEMWTGLEAGFLSVSFQNKDVGIPLSNVKSLVWETECKSSGSK